MLKVSKLHFKSHIKETSYCVKIKVPSVFLKEGVVTKFGINCLD